MPEVWGIFTVVWHAGRSCVGFAAKATGMPRFDQHIPRFVGQILVDLELHAAAGSNGTISSCASSAA